MSDDPAALTARLGGRWHGAYGTAPCPACQPDRRRDQAALSIGAGADGRLLLHCHKGCAFGVILTAAQVPPGRADPGRSRAHREAADREAEAMRARARALWAETLPAAGTLAERYLRNRAITCPIPASLRFHPAAWHGATATRHPAMVAAVIREGFPQPVAVHRTWLAEPGRKADLDPAKASLAPVRGGAIRLTEGPGRLVVAEGIETALSLACGLLPWPARIWSAVSAPGMAALDLPAVPGLLTIAPDEGHAGRSAAHALAERAHRLGWQVTTLEPPPGGGDWNDMLAAMAAEEVNP